MRSRAPRWLVVLWLGAVAACGDDEVSDEDLIQQFIKDVTGPVDDAYVSRALGYVDMARFPLDVRVPHHAGVYPEDRAQEIVSMFKRVMRSQFYETEIKLRSDHVEIQGDSAEVRLGLMTAIGGVSAECTLRKASPGVWKLARVYVDR